MGYNVIKVLLPVTFIPHTTIFDIQRALFKNCVNRSVGSLVTPKTKWIGVFTGSQNEIIRYFRWDRNVFTNHEMNGIYNQKSKIIATQR